MADLKDLKIKCMVENINTKQFDTSVYLAGTMSYFIKQNKPELALVWRLEAESKLQDCGFKVFNPTLNYELNYQDGLTGTFDQNLTYLRKCDIVLVNLKELKNSPYTMAELGASKELGKVIVAFGMDDYYSAFKPFFTKHFVNLDLAVDYIQRWYEQ